MVGVVGDPVEALAEAGQRTGQRPGRQFDARFPVGPQAPDLVEQRRDRGGDESVTARLQVALLHRHEVARRGIAPVGQESVETRLGEKAPHVGQDLGPVIGVGRHPIDHDEQRQTTLVDARQDGPRHLIGVAGRGGHEDAQVGRLDEPVGQGPVGMLERVDVRCVDQGEAGLE